MNEEQEKKKRVIGSLNTVQYHLPGCKFMPYDPDIRVEFESINNAEREGFHPCPDCFPDSAEKEEGVIVSTKTKFYHLPDCNYAPHNVLWTEYYTTGKDAEAHHYRPCPICFPRTTLAKVATVGVGSNRCYHLPGSECLKNYHCTEEFESVKDAENAGYKPCLTCYPNAVIKKVVVVGNNNTHCYHLPGCDFEPISFEKREEFESIAKAEEKGYKPCRYCFSKDGQKTEKIIASNSTNLFHLPSCLYVPLDSEKRVGFESVFKAANAGYSPCKDCFPKLPQKIVPVVGSTFTHQFHIPGCTYEPFASQKRVEFESIKSAVAEGFKPCSSCCKDKEKGNVVVIGSKSTKQFHLLSCEFAPINSEKRLEFKTIQEALQAGFSPCSTCRPVSTEDDEY